jgi:DNA invertase Pin-like site-specific DNA recombinase
MTYLVAYVRVSTSEQVAGLEAQEAVLRATGCTKVFKEVCSSVTERQVLSTCLDFVREGDTLLVSKIDRLARSTADLLTIVSKLEAKGVGLRVLDFGGAEVDTRSPSGKMLLTMFAAVAQFEREIMLERQREGIARAKAVGKYRGRAPTARAKSAQVRDLRGKGLGASEIAAQLQISRASVYRVLADASAG